MTRDELLWLLGSLCSRYRIPFDAALIAQQFPPPCTLTTFHEAARSLGFKTGSRKLTGLDWKNLPLPAVAFIRDEQVPDSVDAPAATPVLMVNNEDGKLLYFRAGTQVPQTLAVQEASAYFEASIILVTKESAGEGKEEDIPGFEAEKKKFGFGWFVPELRKHKHIWRDVLLASLAIQLVGLATPLFTQVIIDKVVVHQARSTLIVLGVGLVMFMLFTSVMSWLRQYLVLHTGNRIDAVLGSHVFRHLLRLPMP